ncbi:carbon-monoxide dehydrogenase medium subunit [Acrocarpospora pleiomorpha]|uniref:Carbon-monoxide dehydrogenase medium subunit n=1 Tax=Acrocarpospora pleiomorpha TaxID=90975 RepID=A0A5M3XRY6_9ACTN|nr:xanthine dehydrogenase family protein subunit M [Acrocarpospora pleiomorpha]GES21973.1 carbon-monoxide dehydrogenase medium subunit [Acrocarpospora pleiomorpha]
MDFLRPTTWAEALAVKAGRPEATPIQGGTDVMVEINLDKGRPAALLDLNPIAELRDWTSEDGWLRIGAGVSYTRLIDELGGWLPGLAQASRTVGSPQIRNRGTVAGNLGAASPAGDSHPPLLASDAIVEAESVRGVRMIQIGDFYTGVKRNALEPDELIRAVRVPYADGPQYFSKIGTRNAMVIAVCSFAIALRPGRRAVGTGIGSAAPTPRRAREAEEFLAGELDWEGRSSVPPETVRRFGELVAQAASPIDDVRGTRDYRVHALAVMARRTLGWAWTEYRGT